MNCKKCSKLIESNSPNLSCFQCNKTFHLKCISSLTRSDFDYIQSTKASWKCFSCDKTKIKRGDETPITPTSEKNKPVFGSQSDNSDSDKSEKSGVKQKEICHFCKKGYSYNSHRAVCVTCKNTFHFKCVDINKDTYDNVKAKWQCTPCSGVTLPVTTTSKEDVLIQVLNEMKQFRMEVQKTNQEHSESINAFRQEVMKKNEEFTNSLNSYSEWIEEHGKQINKLSDGITKIMKEYDEIRQENINLNKKNDILTKRVNILEQSARDKTLEIHGIPFKKEERVMDVIKQVADAIGFCFRDEIVDTCYRLQTAGAAPTNRPTGIIVRFVRKIDKEEFMDLRRKKRNLNTRDIGFMGGDAMPIYVNDSLTPDNRKLLNAAKVIKKDKQFTFLWVKNGRIFMRKNPGDRYVVIDCQDDLTKLQ